MRVAVRALPSVHGKRTPMQHHLQRVQARIERSVALLTENADLMAMSQRLLHESRLRRLEAHLRHTNGQDSGRRPQHQATDKPRR